MEIDIDQLNVEFKNIANEFYELRDIYKKLDPNSQEYEELSKLCDDLDEIKSRIASMYDRWFSMRLIALIASSK